MQIPDPTYMELVPWADATTYVIGQYANVAELQGEDWQRWGTVFFNSPSLGALNPPCPYDYTYWRDWAEKLCDSLGSATGAAGAGLSGGAGNSPTAKFLVTHLQQNFQTHSGNTLVTH